MKVYLAGNLFCEGDLYRNAAWAAKIRDAFPGVDLYSPVESAESKEVVCGDNARLDNTDILVACIDGDVLPSGTCVEIGVVREKIRRGDHKYIVGICADSCECSRTCSKAENIGAASDICEQQYPHQKLYVVSCIKESGVLVNNIDDAIEFMKKVAPEYLQEYVD